MGDGHEMSGLGAEDPLSADDRLLCDAIMLLARKGDRLSAGDIVAVAKKYAAALAGKVEG